MRHALYDELVDWYRLLDPLDDHEDEATDYAKALRAAAQGPCQTLLELGAGAGHTAHHLTATFSCTLSDLSPAMLGLSRAINADSKHVLGDMRKLRLGQQFDAVLIHDAIVYMTSLSDLRAAIETAFVHTRPGGAAIFAPDCVRDSFEDFTELHEERDGNRSLRCMAYTWATGPDATTYVTDYVFLLRDGDDVVAVHDRHVEGLFSESEWLEVIRGAGYSVEKRFRELEEEVQDECAYAPFVFVARRPA